MYVSEKYTFFYFIYLKIYNNIKYATFIDTFTADNILTDQK